MAEKVLNKKVVINRCWGGFGLSYEAVMLYAKLSGFKLYAFTEKRDKKGRVDFDHFVPYDDGDSKRGFVVHYSKKPLNADGSYVEDSYFSVSDIARDDPILAEVVEKLGEKASGHLSELKVVEIPGDVEYDIEDYDGMESIHEVHRSWY